MRNTLNEPWRRNHTANSKRLGTWTRRKDTPPDPREEDDDDE